jgi:hypothetical protein
MNPVFLTQLTGFNASIAVEAHRIVNVNGTRQIAQAKPHLIMLIAHSLGLKRDSPFVIRNA